MDLSGCTTLEETKAVLDTQEFSAYLESISTIEAANGFGKTIAELEKKFNPVENAAELMELSIKRENATDEEKKALGIMIIGKIEEIKETDEFKLFASVIGRLKQAYHTVTVKFHGSGRSNRARRAKQASQLFTENADSADRMILATAVEVVWFLTVFYSRRTCSSICTRSVSFPIFAP